MKWIDNVLQRLRVAPRPNRNARRIHARLSLACLEDRVTPSIVTWTGGGGDNNWTTAANWGGVAPTAGDDLVFADLGAPVTALNDFAAGTNFASITIQSAGYTIVGNSVDLSDDVFATYSLGLSSLQLDTVLGGGDVVVSSGGTLDLSGAISGASGLTVSGGGTLQLSGSGSNTYTGATVLATGTLVLDKTAATAVPGDLSIGTGSTVQLTQSDQIADGSNITEASGATLNLNNFSDTIGTLDLTGATVATGSGTLTLGGNVTTNASSTTSFISGNLDLGGATRTFTVADGSAGTDLTVSASISGTGAGIIKAGGGSAMALSGDNTYDGTTTVSTGGVIVGHANALGATTAGTTVASGATLGFQGSLSFAAEPMTITGNGVGNLGALWSSSGTNTLTGSITLAGNSFIGAESTAPMTISGGIDDQASSFAITKVRSGVVTLAAANTFDGGATVSAGTLALSNGAALGTGAVTVGNGGSLDLSGGITLANTITLNGVPVTNRSKINSLSGDNTIQGDIGITGGNNVAFDVAGGTTLTAAGAISGSLDFDKNGTGTLVLTGTNTNTGNVNVDNGTLLVNGSLATSNTVNVDGVLGGSGTLPAVNISSIGTLAPGNSPGILSTGDLAFQSGGTFTAELTGTTAGTQYDQAAVTGAVNLSDATLALTLGYGPAIGDTFTIIDNDSNDAVTGTFTGLSEGATLITGNVTLVVSYVGGDGNDVTLTVTAVTSTWTGLGGDSFWSTAANWDTNAAPAGGEDLVFAAGAARLTNTNDLSGKSFRSVTFGGAGYTVTGNAITLTDGISATYTSGTSAFGLDTTLTASEAVGVATGGTLTLSGVIAGSGFGLTKTGAGTLALSGANTYTGATTISTGTLVAASAAALGTAAGATTVTNGATLGIQGDVTIAEPISAAGSGAVVNVSGTNTLSGTITLTDNTGVDVTAGALTISGAIGDGASSFGLTKTGAGTLTLSGTNTYDGTTTISAGTLGVATDANLGSGTLALDGGTLGVTSSGSVPTIDNAISVGSSGGTITNSGLNLRLSGQITSAAGVTLSFSSSPSTLVITLENTSNSSSFLGNIVLTSCTLEAPTSGALNAGSITLGTSTLQFPTVGGTFTVANDLIFTSAATLQTSNNTITFSGPISGAFALTKLGSGTAILTGSANSFGATTVSNGTLSIGADGNLGTGQVTLSGGVLDLTNDAMIDNAVVLSGGAVNVASGASALTGAISGSGGLTKTGAGTLTLSGANTYTGATTVSAGTLLVNGSQTGSTVTIDNGATLGGSGSLSGAVTALAGATVAPGNSPAALSTGALTLQSGSTYSVELNGTTAGTQYDRTTVTGAVDLTGAMFTGTFGFTPAIGDVFTIIDNDGTDPVTGTFAGLSEGEKLTLGGVDLVISYVGGTGNDVTLTVPALPTLSISSASVAEGNSGTTALTFTVTLSAESNQPVTVAYATADGTATAGTDYTAATGTLTFTPGPAGAGTLTFAPGVTSLTITVLVTGDTVVEADETVLVVLSSPTNATILTGTGIGTITNDDFTPRIVLGAVGGAVQQIDPVTGQPGASVPAFSGFMGEVRVSSGDVDGDGVDDLVTGAGTGAMGGHVKVFDGATGAERFSFLAFDGFAGGVFVASGDVNGDGFDDIVVGAGAGAAPHVKVFSGADGSLLMSFFAYDTGFRGGVRVAVGDVNGDGFDDIVTGSGAGAPGTVKVFSGTDGALLQSFFAYGTTFTGGVFVAAGDVDGDGFDDIVTGSGDGAPGGHVKVFSGRDFALEASFFAFDPGFVGGVRVGTAVVNGSTAILVGSGPGAHGHFKAFGLAGDELLSLLAAGSDIGGVYVA